MTSVAPASSVTTAICTIGCPTSASRIPGVAIGTALRRLEKEIADDGPDRGHQNQPDDKTVHAMKPLSAGVPAWREGKLR